MPMRPPIRTLPAKPVIPSGATSLVSTTTWGAYPGFSKLTWSSELRFTWTTHGVVQVWLSFPLTVATAPSGVDARDMSSDQPRVTDAHPPSTKQAASTNPIRMHAPCLPQPAGVLGSVDRYFRTGCRYRLYTEALRGPVPNLSRRGGKVVPVVEQKT